MEREYEFRLREKRTARGLTQQELSQRSDVSQAAISSFESHKREPHLPTAIRLAKGLGIPLWELVIVPGMPRPTWTTGEPGMPHGREVTP